MTERLGEAERARDLPALGAAGWGAVPGRDAIRKIWKFRSFSEAWGFMSRTALLAEKLGHHPEWSNSYNVVDVTLITHTCDGLSPLDIDLARRMDTLAGPTAEVQRDHRAAGRKPLRHPRPLSGRGRRARSRLVNPPAASSP